MLAGMTNAGTDPVRIAPIALAHAEGFHACLDSVAREGRYLAQWHALPLERMQGFVKDSVEKHAVQFVALAGERVVAWADVFPHWAHALQHVGTLGMGVHADWRGQGLGRRLLAACLEKAERQGLLRVELSARADNTRAIRLYESLGFRYEGLRRRALRFPDGFHDSVSMAWLAPAIA
jgi:putative acetyltransferase